MTDPTPQARTRIDELQRVCDERAAVIDELQRHLSASQQVASERGGLIELLDGDLRQARIARRQLEERYAALVGENNRLQDLRLDLERTAKARLDEITRLKTTCDERMHEIERISAEAERRSALLADMTAAFEATLRRLEHPGAGGSPSAPRTGSP